MEVNRREYCERPFFNAGRPRLPTATTRVPDAVTSLSQPSPGTFWAVQAMPSGDVHTRGRFFSSRMRPPTAMKLPSSRPATEDTRSPFAGWMPVIGVRSQLRASLLVQANSESRFWPIASHRRPSPRGVTAATSRVASPTWVASAAAGLSAPSVQVAPASVEERSNGTAWRPSTVCTDRIVEPSLTSASMEARTPTPRSGNPVKVTPGSAGALTGGEVAGGASPVHPARVARVATRATSRRRG
ncbi:hypothetical protein [Micropruina sonneratiae]|uniref:hypothetical protein n=1 Tax=Micropruina sonneratiae TaxID=2986940 RepID=UPI002226C4CA|nr:hypothetical protein [Micropruina sp. KQZ13P-5]MCW3158622.1 hypothetical protein [Micropruina sp. KQZ13P-5]